MLPAYWEPGAQTPGTSALICRHRPPCHRRCPGDYKRPHRGDGRGGKSQGVGWLLSCGHCRVRGEQRSVDSVVARVGCTEEREATATKQCLASESIGRSSYVWPRFAGSVEHI